MCDVLSGQVSSNITSQESRGEADPVLPILSRRKQRPRELQRPDRLQGHTASFCLTGGSRVCVLLSLRPHNRDLNPWWLSGKESACNAGVPGSIPGSGRSPGGGHGNPLQYSCLENPMDRGGWWATVHGVAKSRTRLSDEHLHTFLPL